MTLPAKKSGTSNTTLPSLNKAQQLTASFEQIAKRYLKEKQELRSIVAHYEKFMADHEFQQDFDITLSIDYVGKKKIVKTLHYHHYRGWLSTFGGNGNGTHEFYYMTNEYKNDKLSAREGERLSQCDLEKLREYVPHLPTLFEKYMEMIATGKDTSKPIEIEVDDEEDDEE